jgi:hypothetical protein
MWASWHLLQKSKVGVVIDLKCLNFFARSVVFSPVRQRRPGDGNFNLLRMNKKIAFGASAALLAAAYCGATWYTGKIAEVSHTEALEQVRKHLGPAAVLEQQYTKGFFSSQSHVVLQWAQPSTAGAPAETSTPSKPTKVVLDTTVRHGPLAGRHIAAAVAQTRISMPDQALRIERGGNGAGAFARTGGL